MLDVVCELVAEMLNETAHRHGSSITQGANGATHDVLCDVIEHVQIFWATLTVLDTMHHAPQPACAFPARRALAAAFVIVKIGQAQQGDRKSTRLNSS